MGLATAILFKHLVKFIHFSAIILIYSLIELNISGKYYSIFHGLSVSIGYNVYSIIAEVNF
ncbi:hypothetical protein D1627_07345 [Pontibacter oryzae]|uniref:Uncharacterized protein n=1 Tax=Pontibacter oryzae TaxID=2304593 RepID=A0A399SGY9_9BACT|nr:hypothetical protein D1627_07345 [Pontibacter oryzae]